MTPEGISTQLLGKPTNSLCIWGRLSDMGKVQCSGRRGNVVSTTIELLSGRYQMFGLVEYLADRLPHISGGIN